MRHELQGVPAFDGDDPQAGDSAAHVVVIEARIIEDGKAIGVLLRERDGTVSAIRIAVEQLAD